MLRPRSCMYLKWGLFDFGYDVGLASSSPKNMSMNGWHTCKTSAGHAIMLTKYIPNWTCNGTLVRHAELPPLRSAIRRLCRWPASSAFRRPLFDIQLLTRLNRNESAPWAKTDRMISRRAAAQSGTLDTGRRESFASGKWRAGVGLSDWRDSREPVTTLRSRKKCDLSSTIAKQGIGLFWLQ